MNLFTQKNEKVMPLKAAFNFIIVIIVILAFFWFALSRIGVKLDFEFVSDYSPRIIDGFLMTVYLSLASLVLSLLIGTCSALFAQSKILILKYLSKVYVAFIRGTPLIMQIYLFFYIVGTALGVDNRFVSGVIILSIFEGAYISEIIRGGVLALDKTQVEAAKAVGFTKAQSFRHIILPQIIATILPALTGQFASIIKDSSLLSLIALIEITQTMREITAINFQLFEAYFLLGLLYLALTLPITFLSKWMERRYAI